MPHGQPPAPLGPRTRRAHRQRDRRRTPAGTAAASQRFFELHSRPFPASLRDCASKTARTRHCLLRRSARTAKRRPSRPADETGPHRATRLCSTRLRHPLKSNKCAIAHTIKIGPAMRTRHATGSTRQQLCPSKQPGHRLAGPRASFDRPLRARRLVKTGIGRPSCHRRP